MKVIVLLSGPEQVVRTVDVKPRTFVSGRNGLWGRSTVTENGKTYRLQIIGFEKQQKAN